MEVKVTHDVNQSPGPEFCFIREHLTTLGFFLETAEVVFKTSLLNATKPPPSDATEGEQ